MAKVLMLLGSKSDIPVMDACQDYLNWFGIENEMIVASAHRDPEKVVELTKGAEEKGYACIVAAAGMAAALPGVVAAHTPLPVLGVPVASGFPNGMDALLSIVQMPPGLPVGCLAVGRAGAKNAAVMAARIIALTDKSMSEKLNEFKEKGYRV